MEYDVSARYDDIAPCRHRPRPAKRPQFERPFISSQNTCPQRNSLAAALLVCFLLTLFWVKSGSGACQHRAKSVLERISARCCSASTMITVPNWSSLQHRTGRFFDRASIVLVPLDALISVSTNPLLQKQVTSHRGIDRRTPCSACRSTASTIATPSCVIRVFVLGTWD